MPLRARVCVPSGCKCHAVVCECAVARTARRAMVVCAPVDHVLWTESLARVADAFVCRARELGLGEKHLWLTGTASAVAREQLQQQGWTLHEQSEAELWARR